MIFTQAHWERRDDTAPSLRRGIAAFLSAYSAILFVDHPLIGLAYLVATFWFPNVGLAGLVGAAVGMAVGHALRLPYRWSGMNVYSSLLVGLSLGAYYAVDINLLLLVGLSAAATALLTAVLRDLLWRFGRLPVLSVPFVVVALTVALAASSFGGLTPYHAPSQLPPALFAARIDSFLSALGSTFFSPHPIVGALLFAGILWRSRYLALLCVTGYATGALVIELLAAEPAPGFVEWTGFNFALTAMALGGIFAVPSGPAFVYAMLGASVSAILTGALSRLLFVYGLPVMALPFLLTTLTLLAALRLRVAAGPPTLLLENPGLPEQNFERARLARARLGSLDSVPLLAPFLGEWQVYQGFDGPHTHKDRWRYALDFHRVEQGRSFAGDGTELDHYLCFGLPVLSPAYGIVTAIEDALPDNRPGELELRNNWGNYVLIRTDMGLYVLLAHLRQSSVKVKVGQRVTPDTPVASCGNSGRSPQPHLHLQAQDHGGLGGATIPFHLVSSIIHRPGESPEYRLVGEVAEGASVRRADEDNRLAGALHLPVGRTLRYRCVEGDSAVADHVLRIEATLTGRFQLVADSGASAAFEQQSGALGFYDRRGPRDALLDAWLLALGLTPFATLAHSWQDAPAARLLPLGRWAHLALALGRPLGAGIASRYERTWSPAERIWTQSGSHTLEAAGLHQRVETSALLSPDFGCIELSLACAGRRYRAELLAIGQLADRGVPAWEEAVKLPRPSIVSCRVSNS